MLLKQNKTKKQTNKNRKQKKTTDFTQWARLRFQKTLHHVGATVLL